MGYAFMIQVCEDMFWPGSFFIWEFCTLPNPLRTLEKHDYKSVV